MQTLNIVDGDLALDQKGNISSVYDTEAVRLVVEEKLKMIRGEWTFNLYEGMPYFREIFARGVSHSAIKTAFDSEIIKTDGVASLIDSSLQYDKQNRSFSYSAIVGTIYGQTEVNING